MKLTSTSFLRANSLAVAAALSLIAGCATHVEAPAYEPKEGDATLKNYGRGYPLVCSDGVRLNVKPVDPKDWSEYKIPTGKRITISSHMNFTGYNAIAYCTASLSFVPLPNTTYILYSGVSGDANKAAVGCLSEVVREDPTTSSGLAPELSAGPPTCK